MQDNFFYKVTVLKNYAVFQKDEQENYLIHIIKEIDNFLLLCGMC